MKKWYVVLSLMLALFLLSSCAMIPAARLAPLFQADSGSVITSGTTTAQPTGDTVTISREEYEKYQRFTEMYDLYEMANTTFYEEPDQDKLAEYAARGVLAGLGDPYTFYYNPEEYTRLWEDDEGTYSGIGVMISANMKTQACVISRVFKGSPAEEVGVNRGDVLYRVGEDMYITASNLDEMVNNYIRGPEGTTVELTVLRNDEEMTFTIERRSINVNQIEYKMLDGDVGYIALYQFAGQCEKEFESALNNLIAQNAKGVIIDLRDNGGGWVDQALYIADLFMDEGKLCSLAYRDGIMRDEEYRTADGKVNTKLVMLINENTASSSEILTGALRDCAGASVVGVKSFGKGIIQIVSPVGSRGAGFQMTVAQYYTPNGDAVHQIGITPEFEVPLPEGDNGMYDFADLNKDVQLIKAYDVMKDKLKEE